MKTIGLNVRELLKATSLNAIGFMVSLFVLLLPMSVQAERFCLLMAENYYEQLYCEIKAQGQGKRLPTFYDFQRNNEVTQAFLLKRPAAKLGIEVVQPKMAKFSKSSKFSKPSKFSKSNKTNKSIQVKPTNVLDKKPASVNSSVAFAPRSSGVGQCVFRSVEARCGNRLFHLVGNKSNNRLAPGVLSHANKMMIPAYEGDVDDSLALGRYLALAYGQYVAKMLEIGLGGSTFSYAKFTYLYHDVTAKGIDFGGRFETMFSYLKQDKQNLAVSEKLPGNLTIDRHQCERMSDDLLVCDAGRKNYLYQRQR